ncbi:TPR_REGION domain-containing protein [Haematococcus lacustris]|uniref:TPR_REGION domain-containing protein n=1 Tax=Haematococcus lacustris TaxID=44745 RepID=A0A699YNT3_HAELA|nr:TPR_REGION domain-containing protein [Haematococcus lacustris]
MRPPNSRSLSRHCAAQVLRNTVVASRAPSHPLSVILTSSSKVYPAASLHPMASLASLSYPSPHTNAGYVRVQSNKIGWFMVELHAAMERAVSGEGLPASASSKACNWTTQGRTPLMTLPELLKATAEIKTAQLKSRPGRQGWEHSPDWIKYTAYHDAEVEAWRQASWAVRLEACNKLKDAGNAIFPQITLCHHLLPATNSCLPCLDECAVAAACSPVQGTPCPRGAVLAAQATRTAPASAQHAPGVLRYAGEPAGSGSAPAGKSNGYTTTPAARPREAASELHTAPLPSSAEGQSAEQPSTIWEEDDVQHEEQHGSPLHVKAEDKALDGIAGGQGRRQTVVIQCRGPRATTLMD